MRRGGPPPPLAGELARAGYPAPELSRRWRGRGWPTRLAPLVEEVAPQLLGHGGRLASEKTFTRADVVVAVAPYLHGLPVSYLDEAVETVLSHEHAVALPLVAGAREPVFAAACVIEDEAVSPSWPTLGPGRPGPQPGAAAAVRQTELSGGFRLSQRQAEGRRAF